MTKKAQRASTSIDRNRRDECGHDGLGRCRGVGSALWAAGTADLRAAGLLPAGLWVIEGNERARAFYERRGWVFTGTARLDSSSGDPIDEVRYVSEVTAGHSGGLGSTA